MNVQEHNLNKKCNKTRTYAKVIPQSKAKQRRQYTTEYGEVLSGRWSGFAQVLKTQVLAF